jgi:MinD-like ATPase involved in chromosome partitioning or flagellar assembly
MTEVLTGLSPRWESPVAEALEALPGVTIARRCADVAELLSVAEAGLGSVAVVSWDLRGLDLEVVDRLRRSGFVVVGLVPGADEDAERRLRQLSIHRVVPVDAEPERLAEALADRVPDDADALEAAFGHAAPGAAVGEEAHVAGGDPGPADVLPPSPADEPVGWTPRGASAPAATGDLDQDSRDAGAPDVLTGRPSRAPVLAVWGPNGAPGRTTVATTLAAELASRGVSVLLVDADTYGGCVAQALGVLDEAPGVAAACRAADQGLLDLPALARIAPEVVRGLRVLTGLPKAERWPEVRAGALERVLDLARSLVDAVVVDCGFCLEDDEELSYDTSAPRRNEATLTALAVSDLVVAVGGGDPVGLQRFVRGLQELGTVPSGDPVPVVNRVRASAVGSRPQGRIADSLARFAGLGGVRFVPDDPEAVDGAMLAGRSVVEHAPDSALRRAVADLASHVAPWTVPQQGSLGRRRRVGWRRQAVRA